MYQTNQLLSFLAGASKDMGQWLVVSWGASQLLGCIPAETA